MFRKFGFLRLRGWSVCGGVPRIQQNKNNSEIALRYLIKMTSQEIFRFDWSIIVGRDQFVVVVLAKMS